MQNDAIIFAITGSKNITTGAQGTTPKGLRYSYLIEDFNDRNLRSQTGIFAVSLPFATGTHLLGIPKGKEQLVEVWSSTHKLEPVQLEGDYNSYFSLYAATNQQIESRILLDPATMEYSVDFCSNYVWEIVNDALYFANEGVLPELKVIDDFVTKLTPARPVSAAMNINQRPQTVEQLSPIDSELFCPVCSTVLHAGRRWLACSAGHGYLLRQSDITQTRKHMNDIARHAKASVGAMPSVVTPIVTDEHADIRCPNDGELFEKTIYQGTSAFLYVCHSCTFRWIDGKDLNTILGMYRNDGEDEIDRSEDNSSESTIGTIGNMLMHDVHEPTGL